MVSSYTANGRITKQGTNDNPNTWGLVTNNQVIELFEEAVFGVIDIDLTGSADVTLTTANGATDQARHAVLELTGLIGDNITLFVPATEKIYAIRAAWSGDFTVTVQISGSATSVVLERGQKAIVYLNGTDIYDLVDIDPTQFLNTANNLADIPDDAVARANLGLGDFATKTVGTGFTDVGGTISTNPYFVGEKKELFTSTVPSGWLECNGASVSRTTYAALFAAIGVTYGAGNGTTTFTLPDTRGRSTIGKGQGDTAEGGGTGTLFALGSSGGAETHTLTIPELAAHFHTHSRYRFTNASAGSGGTTLYQTTTADTSTVGGDSPHNNMSPYLATTHIIYAGV